MHFGVLIRATDPEPEWDGLGDINRAPVTILRLDRFDSQVRCLGDASDEAA